jgi:hypothetical protein
LKASAAAEINGSRAVDPDTDITSSAAADEEIAIMKIIIIGITLIVIVPPCSYRDLKCKKLNGDDS